MGTTGDIHGLAWLRRIGPGAALLLLCVGVPTGCDKLLGQDDGGEAEAKDGANAKRDDADGKLAGGKKSKDKADKGKDKDKAGKAKADKAKDGKAKDGEAKDGEAKDGEEPKHLAEKLVADAEEKAMDEIGSKVVNELFDPENETIRKQGCEFLTADMVAKHFDVAAADLKTLKIMGCVHNWKDDQTLVEVQLAMPMVHKDVDKAKVWFANQTKSRTKEELDGQMDTAKGKLDERPELDSSMKKKTAKGMAELAKMAMPDEGVTYDDVPDLGDEAKISSFDGTLWIRVANLTFSIVAYKGPKKPALKIVNPRDVKGLAKKSMELQQKWIKDTVEERKAAALKIAPDVIKAFAERD